MAIFYRDSIDSTNLEAGRLMAAGAVADMDVVQAGFQTLGRGQRGNIWYSLEGENLLFSIICFHQKLKATQFFEINQRASVAVVEYLLTRGIKARIKWPNDILVGTKKISGILIENTILQQHISTSIVGIGINLNASVFPLGLQQTATSVYLENPGDYSTNTELEKFMECFRKEWYYDRFQVKQHYIKHLFAINQKLQFRHNGIVFTAINAGVDNQGRLMLIMPNRRTAYFSFKEIEWVL
jgi:BirA family biotin operon repressor/biotin-[acetyl-CoA-carboxylase] ligase